MARVYLEWGDLPNAGKWYRTGYETSKKIKDLTPAQADLWQMRWLHAQARIAARRGNAAEARTHAATMKTLLDKGENENERPQYQYLLGYIALEAGDADTAIAELQKANLDDSFVLGLLARAYEKKGDAAKAAELHTKAWAAPSHSINTAFSRQWAKKAAIAARADRARARARCASTSFRIRSRRTSGSARPRPRGEDWIALEDSVVAESHVVGAATATRVRRRCRRATRSRPPARSGAAVRGLITLVALLSRDPFRIGQQGSPLAPHPLAS